YHFIGRRPVPDLLADSRLIIGEPEYPHGSLVQDDVRLRLDLVSGKIPPGGQCQSIIGDEPVVDAKVATGFFGVRMHGGIPRGAPHLRPRYRGRGRYRPDTGMAFEIMDKGSDRLRGGAVPY